MGLKIGYIEETLAVPAMEKVYEELRSYLEKTLKIPVENVGIPLEEASKFESNSSLETDIDILFVTMDLAIFEDTSHFVASSVYAYSETSFISANPEPFVHNSLSIFMIELSFFLALTLCLIVVSLMMMIILYYHGQGISRGRDLSWKRWTKLFYLRLMAKMWFFSNSFLFQAIPKIPKTISARLLCSGWLISCEVIHIFLSCYLKSDLSMLAYHTVDNLEDVNYYPNSSIVLAKNALEERYFKRMAPSKPEYKQMLDKIKKNNGYIEIPDFLDPDFYKKLSTKEQILIFNIKLWKIFANLGLADTKFKVNLYIGKDIIKRDPLVLPVKKSLPSELKENITLRISRVFECYVYRYLEMEDDYRVLFHSWEPPLKNQFNPTNVDDIMAGILLLTFGYTLAVIVATFKISFYMSKSMKKKRPRITPRLPMSKMN